MTEQRKKILWLVSWYPNKFDPFDGDFIQRHAKAAALYNDIHVLFIKPSAAQERREEVLQQGAGLTEQIIYLPNKNGLTGKIQSQRCWWQVSLSAAESVIREWNPALIHVHVPWKAGLVAVWLKKKYQIPFHVTEHWGIYNQVVDDNIHTRSFLFRRLLKQVYAKATTFISVSRFLAAGVNDTLVKKSFTVVPNVVDTGLFFPAAKQSRFTFLHVSNMVPLKNVEGLLAGFRQFLVNTKADAQMVMIGNRDQRYVRLTREMNLDTAVFFRGELPYADVAKEMQQTHTLVLNSDMENSPCVIGEALCCGLPVIATAVGGIPELVSEKNSIVVPPRDVTALADAFQQMISSYHQYDAAQIAADARQRFSYEAVGRLFHLLYQ